MANPTTRTWDSRDHVSPRFATEFCTGLVPAKKGAQNSQATWKKRRIFDLFQSIVSGLPAWYSSNEAEEDKGVLSSVPSTHIGSSQPPMEQIKFQGI
ncbi:hypothetical protein STEG23_028882 [Scotinomys teguina]